jgi:hypothetical protein
MRYVQNPAICAAELDGEVCLFNPATADYLNLNGPASAIWNLLAQPAGEDAIVRSLAERYEVAEDVCRRDTRAFLRRAVERGMLEERRD